MVQKCFIVGCKSQFNSASKISFFLYFVFLTPLSTVLIVPFMHRFPSEENQKQKWINAIRGTKKQSCGTISKHLRICEKHFQKHEIRRFRSRCILAKGAFPTIFNQADLETSRKEFQNVEMLEPSSDELLLRQQENPVHLNRVLDEQYMKQSTKIIQEMFLKKTDDDCAVFVCQMCGYHNSMPSTSQQHEERHQTEAKFDLCSSQPQILMNSLSASQSNMPCTETITYLLDGGVFLDDIGNDKSMILNNTYSANDRIFVENVDKDEENLVSTHKRGTKRRLCYPGDVRGDEVLTLRSSKVFIHSLKATINKQRRKISNLYQQNWRSKKRIASLKALLKELKQKHYNRKNIVS